MCQKCQRKRPTFNYPDEFTPLFCKGCATDTMIDVTTKKCEKCQLKQPSFNEPGELNPLFCKGCATDTMIDVTTKKCENCKSKTPCFNEPGELVPLFCKGCATDSMVDVKHRMCQKCQRKRPTFNELGESVGLFCKACATDTMISVTTRKCEKCQLTQACFNEPGESTGLFCKKCATDTMVNVKTKKCQKCHLKGPKFNQPGESVGLFCKKCASDTMINVRSKKCEHCDSVAVYGPPGLQATHCSKHKQSGTIARPRTKCMQPTCRLPATHGSTVPMRCDQHTCENDVNLVLRNCKQCSRLEVCDEKQVCYEYCLNSEIFHRRRKIWEERMIKVLEKNIKAKFYSLDRSLNTACNSKRPDVAYHRRSYFLLVECDEKQHKYYGDACEINRLILIAKAAGLPILVVRYNPDSYLDSDGCPSTISDAAREKELVRIVKSLLDKPAVEVSEYIRVTYLFYDGYEISSEPAVCSTIPLPPSFFDCAIVDSPKRKRKFIE